MPTQSITLSDPPANKIKALYQICATLVASAEANADASTQGWHSWFYTYLLWHESAQLSTRTQRGAGPGRGLMQFEATTAWDTIKIHVLGPTPGLIARLADAAGVDADSQMKPALRGFAALGDPDNVWPDDSPVNQVEAWLLSSDSFGICLMQIQFERFHATLPPLPPVAAGEDPRNTDYHAQFAQVWADSWWKGPADQQSARLQQFLTSAATLDQALPQLVASTVV
jgi:hypothetical protein